MLMLQGMTSVVANDNVVDDHKWLTWGSFCICVDIIVVAKQWKDHSTSALMSTQLSSDERTANADI